MGKKQIEKYKSFVINVTAYKTQGSTACFMYSHQKVISGLGLTCNLSIQWLGVFGNLEVLGCQDSERANSSARKSEMLNRKDLVKSICFHKKQGRTLSHILRPCNIRKYSMHKISSSMI